METQFRMVQILVLGFKYHFIYTICFLPLFYSCNQSEISINKLNKEGGKIGEWVYFSDSLDTLRKEFYNSESMLWKEERFVLNKKAIERFYERGVVLKELLYFDNNNIKSITTYDNGKKRIKETFFKNGLRQTLSYFNNDKYPTKFNQFYKNGKLQFETDHFGNGPANFYDSLGNLKMILEYRNLQIVDTLEIY